MPTLPACVRRCASQSLLLAVLITFVTGALADTGLAGASIGGGEAARVAGQRFGGFLFSAILSRMANSAAPISSSNLSSAALPGLTLPSGPTVAAGAVSFLQQGNTLSVTNSPGAIINWQSFSIGAGATTNFIQQSAASSVLNRVTGSDPSVILGQLTSNGNVFLINQSGILVGAGARIDVGGLVASTLNMSDSDFLSGSMVLGSGPLWSLLSGLGTPRASVDNAGAITTPTGGRVYLVGSNVHNSGVITAPGGEILLAAGAKVQIGDTSTPGVTIQVVGDETAQNLGSLIAQSGRIGLVGALVKNSGRINADQVTHGASGKIYLLAKKDVTLGDASVISADGADGDGGTITIRSEDSASLSGTISAKGGSSGNGGHVETSAAAFLMVLSDLTVDTSATNGTTGNWLIDPSGNAIVPNGTSGNSGTLSAGATLCSSLASSCGEITSWPTGSITSNVGPTGPIGGLVGVGTSGATVLKAGVLNLTTISINAATGGSNSVADQ
jgi:filamentous hemagglutinin family protein